jgi:hypothetical protein
MVWIVALAVTACGGKEGGGAAPVTRDSAGITIVDNSAPAWAEGQGWTVSDSILLDISGADIDSALGPVPLANGGVAIGVAGTREIRTYDASGNLLTKVGRQGSGPGEFLNLSGLWVGPGDSLLVLDVFVRRLSVIDPAGVYQRSFSLGGAGGSLMPVDGKVEMALPIGWLGDGTIPGMALTFAINSNRQGKYRDSVSALLYDAGGAMRDTITRFPGIEMQQMPMNVSGQSFSAPIAVLLGKVTMTTADRDRFYVAQNNAWEVEVRTPDGTLLKLIRLPKQAVALTPEMVETHRKEALEVLESNQMLRSMPEAIKKQMLATIEQAVYPETLPFIDGILIDPARNIWVSEVQPPGIETRVYAVFDSAGAFQGRVSMPNRFRASAIGADVVYGVWLDPDDVQHVRTYRLRKGS